MQTNSQNLNKSNIPLIFLILGCCVSEISSFLPYMVIHDPLIGQVNENGTTIILGFLLLTVAVIIAGFSAFYYNRATDQDEIRSSRKLALIAFIFCVFSLAIDLVYFPVILGQFESQYGKYLNGIPISTSFGLGFYALILGVLLFFIGIVTISISLAKVKKIKTPMQGYMQYQYNQFNK